MRREESATIQKWLQVYSPFASAINLGSGNVEQLKLNKPWVHHDIFAFLESVGTVVFHCDIQAYPGVDRLIDLTSENPFAGSSWGAPKLVLLNNVLEHLPRNAIVDVCEKISSFLQAGDSLIVSVPHRYPFHPDPIDTLFRPSPRQLTDLFPQLQVRNSEIVEAGSFFDEWREMRTLKRLRKLLNPLFPFRRPSRYLSDLHRLSFFFRTYKISLVLLYKNS